MTDFSQTLIRCSSLGVLFTEPQSKADKDAGELSKTAKSHLIEVYIAEKWGRRRDITTKQMNKGNLVEDEAIAMISLLDGKFYEKNQERRSNGYITGHPDVVDEIVHDAKASWDPWTFLPKLIEPLDKMYNCQLQGYMWLWDKDCAQLRYCLVSTPQMLIENEKRRLLFNMDVISDENQEYQEAAEELERNMVFDDIPMEQRVITKFIKRDETIIAHIPEKVEKARAFMQKIESMHLYGSSN